MFTKAVSPERVDGQTSYVGSEWRGSLKNDFMNKQPWSYKMDSVNHEMN